MEEELAPPATGVSFEVIDGNVPYAMPTREQLQSVKRDPTQDPRDARYSLRIAGKDDPRANEYAPNGVELRAAAKWAVEENYKVENWMDAAIAWGVKPVQERMERIEWSLKDDEHRLYHQGRNTNNCAKRLNSAVVSIQR